MTRSLRQIPHQYAIVRNYVLLLPFLTLRPNPPTRVFELFAYDSFAELELDEHRVVDKPDITKFPNVLFGIIDSTGIWIRLSV